MSSEIRDPVKKQLTDLDLISIRTFTDGAQLLQGVGDVKEVLRARQINPDGLEIFGPDYDGAAAGAAVRRRRRVPYHAVDAPVKDLREG